MRREPVPLSTKENEALALFFIRRNLRQPAKTSKPRGQDQPAARFELPEADMGAVAGVEGREGGAAGP